MTVDAHRALRTTVLWVALLNLAYFFVEGAVALIINSASLMADSVDFLEDVAVNLLILLALTWSNRARAYAGKAMAIIICMPALAAAWQIFLKTQNPEAPEALSLIFTAGGAVVVNSICAYLLTRFRAHSGALAKAAFLAARNDVYVNLAIIAMALLTAFTHSGWPDIVLAAVVLLVNLSAAHEVWETAEEERLAAKALAGEEID